MMNNDKQTQTIRFNSNRALENTTGDKKQLG